ESVFLADLDHAVQQVKGRRPIGTYHDDRPQAAVLVVGVVASGGEPSDRRFGGDIALDIFVRAKDFQFATRIDIQNQQVLPPLHVDRLGRPDHGQFERQVHGGTLEVDHQHEEGD